MLGTGRYLMSSNIVTKAGVDSKTLASINLHAVLRNIQEICSIDEVAKAEIADKDLSVKFIVKGLDPTVLTFKNGKCTYSRGENEKAKIKLYFSSPEKFNALIDGENVTPLPLGGLTKLGFMTSKDSGFSVLSKRLEYYLKPPAEEKEARLSDSVYFETNTKLTAFTAFHALAEIANYDPIGSLVGKRFADGQICVEVLGTDIAVTLTCKGGKMSAKIGRTETPAALMQFGNLDIVHKVLNGQADVFGAMGSGLFDVSGYIPMLDNMSKLLSFVSRYLA